jgi:hypothetical protein
MFFFFSLVVVLVVLVLLGDKSLIASSITLLTHDDPILGNILQVDLDA